MDKFTFWKWSDGEEEPTYIYTVTETPEVGDSVYSAPNVETAVVVTAVGTGTITTAVDTYTAAGSIEVDLIHPIITAAEMYDLARVNYIDDDICKAYIEESELVNIKNAIGEGLYIALTTSPSLMKFDLLLNGGHYTANGKTHTFGGLKKALAYYAYARAVKAYDGVPTRFGNKTKRGDYSDKAQFTERNTQYREAYEVADQLLADCLQYIKSDTATFPTPAVGRVKSPHSMRIRILGN